LDKIRDEAMLKTAREGKAEATDPVILTQGSATNAAVVSTVQGGGGYFEKRTNDFVKAKAIAIEAPSPKTTLIPEFDKSLAIARTFWADQQHDSVAKTVRGYTRSWLATRSRNAFGVY